MHTEMRSMSAVKHHCTVLSYYDKWQDLKRGAKGFKIIAKTITATVIPREQSLNCWTIREAKKDNAWGYISSVGRAFCTQLTGLEKSQDVNKKVQSWILCFNLTYLATAGALRSAHVTETRPPGQLRNCSIYLTIHVCVFVWVCATQQKRKKKSRNRLEQTTPPARIIAYLTRRPHNTSTSTLVLHIWHLPHQHTSHPWHTPPATCSRSHTDG